MFNQYHLSRSAFTWLLVCQLFLLMPHWLRFPALLLPPSLICVLWSLQIFRGRWSYPPQIIRGVFIIASVAGLVAQGFRWHSTEFMVCLLLLAYILKLLEMREHRDVLIMAYLSYFVIVGQLLFSQSLATALYLFMGLCLCTTFLISAYSARDGSDFFLPLKTASKMTVLSLPIMLVAFLVFPRLQPFWSVPLSGAKAKTGISDSMTPGMFSELAKSDQLAFSGDFEGDVPPLRQLYWRGLVLTQFDGRRWTALPERRLNKWNSDDFSRDQDQSDQPLQYMITMEPSFKSWLFTLASVVQSRAVDGENINYLRDATVQTTKPILQRSQFKFRSEISMIRDVQVYRYHRDAALELPATFNPETRSFAEALYEKSGYDKAYIDAVLGFFHDEDFYYSLSPGRLGEHYIDDFLFRSRVGFCEHYASSFVVLMRAVGIPARVVTGYQGGDLNPYERHISVRQMDAHAWAEVWLAGVGWQRVDPTAAVAPERIERGSLQSLQNDEAFLAGSPFSSRHFQSMRWMLTLSYRYDQLNALWHSQVLAYSGDVQQNTLKRLLGEVSIRNLALLVAGSFAFFALIMLAYFTPRYRPIRLSDEQRFYRRFIRKAARAGLHKGEAEGAMDFMRRCIVRWPHHEQSLQAITEAYIYLGYAMVDGADAQVWQGSEFSDQHYRQVLKTLEKSVKGLSLKA